MRTGIFVIKRGLHAVITLFVVLSLMFLLFRVMLGPAGVVPPTMCPENKHGVAVHYGFEEIVHEEKHLNGFAIVQGQNLVISYKDYPDLLSLSTHIFSFNVTLTRGQGCNAVGISIYHDGRVYGTEPDGNYSPDELVGYSTDNSSTQVRASYRNGIPTYINNTDIILVIHGENITGTGHFDLTFGTATVQKVPLYRQYFVFIKSALMLDFGNSFITGQPVWHEVKDGIWPTLLLLGSAGALSIIISIPASLALARRKGSRTERATFLSLLFFYSVPAFWLALIALWELALKYRIFPLGGMNDPTPEGGWHFFGMYANILHHMALPLIILVAVGVAGNMLFMREPVNRAMDHDLVRTLRAKGLKERTIMCRHVLKMALPSALEHFPLLLGIFISVEMVLEIVFSWPGIGHMLLSSIMGQNYPVAQGIFFFLTVLSIALIFLFEIIVAYLNPAVLSVEKGSNAEGSPASSASVPFRQLLRSYRHNRVGLFAAGVILMFVLTAILAPYITYSKPMETSVPEIDRYAPQIGWAKYMNATPQEFNTGNYEHISTGPATAFSTYSPMVSLVYIGTDRGNVYAINTIDGFPAWIQNVGRSNITAIHAENEGGAGLESYLYVSTESGHILKIHDSSRLNTSTNHREGNGVIMWNFPTGVEITAEPVVNQNGNTVYVANWDGDVFAIDSMDGTLRWKTGLNDPVKGDMALSHDGSTLYLGTASDGDGDIYAVDTSDHTYTKYDVGKPLNSGLSYDERGHVLYYTIGDTLYSRDVSYGSLSGLSDATELRLTGVLTAPTVDKHTGNIYLGSSDGTVYSVRNNMTLRWKTETSMGSIGIAPVYYDRLDLLYTGTSSNNFLTINAYDGSIRVLTKTVAPLSGQPLPVDAVPQDGAIKIDYQRGLFIATPASLELANAVGKSVLPRPPTWIEPAPSGNTYPLGTDPHGISIWSSMVYGSIPPLSAGFLTALLSLLIGLSVGLLAGYAGGKTDAVVKEIVSIMKSIPLLPFILVVAVILQSANHYRYDFSSLIWSYVWPMVAIGWAYVAIPVRDAVRDIKRRSYVLAAEIEGLGRLKVIGRHILPGVVPVASVYFMFIASAAIILGETGAFMGIRYGIPITWARVLVYTISCGYMGAWWTLFPPGLAITLLSFSLFLIGRSIKESIVQPEDSD